MRFHQPERATRGFTLPYMVCEDTNTTVTTVWNCSCGKSVAITAGEHSVEPAVKHLQEHLEESPIYRASKRDVVVFCADEQERTHCMYMLDDLSEKWFTDPIMKQTWMLERTGIKHLDDFSAGNKAFMTDMANGTISAGAFDYQRACKICTEEQR